VILEYGTWFRLSGSGILVYGLRIHSGFTKFTGSFFFVYGPRIHTFWCMVSGFVVLEHGTCFRVWGSYEALGQLVQDEPASG